MINTQEEAYKYAQPYFAKEDTKTVYVNQHGLVWVNNEPEQMEVYFATKKERYFIFQNVEQSTEEQPLLEEPTEGEQPTEEAPVKNKRNKK